MIQTVKGRIAPEQLGKTMTHEHFLWDQRCWWKGEPDELSLREFVHQEVKIENLGMLRYHAHQNLDNIVQLNVALAIEEASFFKMAGGSSIVDATSIGIGRAPEALLAISEMTGLNVIMGAGYYVSASHPAEIRNLDKFRIAEKIINEFNKGVKDTGIKPGIIGEIGVADVNNPEEVKVLQAAAIAHKEVGAPIFIHPPIFETKGHEILDILESEGADPAKVVMCHCDPTLDKPEYHDSIAKRGAYIEYDQFGLEIMALEGFFLPRDIERIRAIQRQIVNGNLTKIVISQDVCFKTCLIKYGGWGYGHILRDIIPLMRKEGFTDNDLDAILIENPKRILGS